MRCPQCGERETRVVDSRDLDDAATIRRRRECGSCSLRFTTYERIEAARLVIVKRDGTRQEFDRDKLASGLRHTMMGELQTKVFLELFVRVQKEWSENSRILKEFGYE